MKNETNQNITVSLPRTLIRKAKIFAASIDQSLTALIRNALEKQVTDGAKYRAARARQLRILEKGFDLGSGGDLKFSRDELHDR